ncbi:hypothetical protein [Bacteroides thetaiotaomicron]|uniref:hypothetical protein n=1 Tax=Bacteroides thetaiotaomicron TaxID=818 RepID=UPI001F261DA3|nr:hypothetical protein [Bacteroides thetaiotaomicron]MCE8780833.1 hypothetical protein [Bacteroides thetaiotaomicron]
MDQFITDLDKVVKFAKEHPIGCTFVAVYDSASFNPFEVKQNYYEQERYKFVRIIDDNEFKTLNETNGESGNSIEALGHGAYMNKVIYVGVPCKSEEFPITRILQHELGHYIQERNNGYTNRNCDLFLYEYHNIWFYENPYNRDALNNYDRIDMITRFRLSYANKIINISDNLLKNTKESFDLDFCSFYNKYQHVIKSGDTDKNMKLLKDIYDSVQAMRQENSSWLPLYYKLFYFFTKGL